MRTALVALVLAAMLAPAAAGDVAETIILGEMKCDRPPDAAGAVKALIATGAIVAKAFRVADSVSFFRVSRPLAVDGINVAAVLAYDESGKFAFKRSPGTSPGATFGIVTSDPLPFLDDWKKRHSTHLVIDDSMTDFARAKDVVCSRND